MFLISANKRFHSFIIDYQHEIGLHATRYIIRVHVASGAQKHIMKVINIKNTRLYTIQDLFKHRL